jgi:ferric-dicitrate binding protein FerR (iron transport regulator)
MYALAASLVLAIGLSSRLLVKQDGAKAEVLGALAGLDVQTAVGERREFELPDGSKAVLGVRSTLRFEPALATAPRVVHLDGEAFFTVKHDPTRPFRVLASNVVTEDIGTEFSVRAYAGEEQVRVAVREGAVAISRRGDPDNVQPILLGQRDVAVVATAGEPKVISDSLVDRLFAWRNGDLVFDNASLAEVASELSRWYDVDIRFADSSLAARHLTSTFKSDPIDDVLRVIGLSAEVRFERRGRVVTVHAAPRTSTGDPVGPRSSNNTDRADGGLEAEDSV